MEKANNLTNEFLYTGDLGVGNRGGKESKRTIKGQGVGKKRLPVKEPGIYKKKKKKGTVLIVSSIFIHIFNFLYHCNFFLFFPLLFFFTILFIFSFVFFFDKIVQSFVCLPPFSCSFSFITHASFSSLYFDFLNFIHFYFFSH